MAAARKAIVNSRELLDEVEEELEYDCERLRGFLRAAQVRLRPFSPSFRAPHVPPFEEGSRASASAPVCEQS